ncbi:MAG: ribose 5-phosphate isomerase A [Candidatus Bathyarchaeia archaeon]
MKWKEAASLSAAEEAAKLVKNGDVVGLGTGSTAAHVISAIARRIHREKLSILGVPTSYQTQLFAAKQKIPMTSLEENSVLDIAIDGADQIDKSLNLIKGGGAALTREKIVGSCARRYVIVADETKLNTKLGLNQSVPVEVLPFGFAPTLKKLAKFSRFAKVRQAERKAGPVVTDNGNLIVDTYFGTISKPLELDLKIKRIPGVIESGIFPSMANLALIGLKNASVKRLARR